MLKLTCKWSLCLCYALLAQVYIIHSDQVGCQTCSTCISLSLGTHALAKYTSQFVSSFICQIKNLAVLYLAYWSPQILCAEIENQFSKPKKHNNSSKSKQIVIDGFSIYKICMTKNNDHFVWDFDCVLLYYLLFVIQIIL